MKRGKSGDKKSSVKAFMLDYVNRFFLVMTAVINIVSWLLVAIIINSLSSPIILRYNSYLGIVAEGRPFFVFLLPLTGYLILVFNVVLGVYFIKKNKLTSRILMADSFLYNLLITIAIGALIMVNRP